MRFFDNTPTLEKWIYILDYCSNTIIYLLRHADSIQQNYSLHSEIYIILNLKWIQIGCRTRSIFLINHPMIIINYNYPESDQ